MADVISGWILVEIFFSIGCCFTPRLVRWCHRSLLGWLDLPWCQRLFDNMLNAKTSLRNCQVMLASAGSVSFPIVISLYFSSCIFCSGSCMRWVQETAVFSAFMFFVNSSSYAVKVRSGCQLHDFITEIPFCFLKSYQYVFLDCTY